MEAEDDGLDGAANGISTTRHRDCTGLGSSHSRQDEATDIVCTICLDGDSKGQWVSRHLAIFQLLKLARVFAACVHVLFYISWVG